MRNKVSVITFFLLCSSISICTAQTQYEMNTDAGAKYQAADKKLNILYQEILKEYAVDTAFIRNLKVSQRIWIQFRDAEMKMKYPDRPDGYYGSVFPMCWAEYLTQLTQERINTLQEWHDGTPEGDVCCGSVKRKN